MFCIKDTCFREATHGAYCKNHQVIRAEVAESERNELANKLFDANAEVARLRQLMAQAAGLLMDAWPSPEDAAIEVTK